MVQTNPGPNREPGGPRAQIAPQSSPPQVPQRARGQGWVIVGCLVLVTASELATAFLPTQTGWTPEDHEVLKELATVMSDQDTVEQLEERRTQPDAQTEKYQDAFDVIIKLFSKDNNAG